MLASWIAANELPSSRDEAWRYTPVADIIDAFAAAAIPDHSGSVVADTALVDRLAGDFGGTRLVFVNGVVRPDLSDVASADCGDRCARGRHTAGVGAPPDVFAALNELAAVDVASVDVDADAPVDRTVHVVHLAAPGQDPTVSHPRTVIRVGARSTCEIVETYAGLAGPAVTNAWTHILAGESARVTYHRVQEESPDAVHVGATVIEADAGAQVKVTSLMTGGSLARSTLTVRLQGPAARADVSGLYLPARRQRLDNVITVDHAAPRCKSTQLFKGVIDDHAQGSFTGHVIVRAGAAGTDATQTSRSLTLSPTAQADTRPWLQIFADDVRCAHGGTVGRLDDDALFYLRSRGIPHAKARNLLVAAFAGEVTDMLTPPALRERAAAMLAERLPSNSA
jgi:Fe-S cluster assembly protein SufD